MTTHGRVTLPTQAGFEQATIDLAARVGADAVRNSDGTQLPEDVARAFTKAYATYFVARGDNEWAQAHRDELQQYYLLSRRHTAPTTGPLTIDPMEGYFAEQVTPNTDDDPHRWWEVIDRTTGEVVRDWSVDEAGQVTIPQPAALHEYTVAFLAWDIWDPTQMYNHLTNAWGDKPHELPFDARHPQTWAHMKRALNGWLESHPHVDVVRFTTFFYHFTLVYDDAAREKFVDWFGYSASVSPAAIDAFEAEKGYRLRAEDFVDAGFYNSPFRVPSQAFRDWIDFQQRFVADRARQLVEQVHAAGKEAMMFLGDNWIGTEPYGEHFGSIGLDAVVGSVGSGATLRMISDIPHVRYTEGRLLPYFFPDVFCESGDPVGEADENWLTARRALVRKPLDRIGYGGYLSLALEHPAFIDRLEEICQEFRDIHDRSGGVPAHRMPVTVGVLNAWGRLRSWQTHMVAHALWYKQIYSYLGALEALSGLPVSVRFLSFEEVAAGGVPAEVDVLLNAGAAGTSWSGGAAWDDVRLVTAVRRAVAEGTGLIGIGEPSAHLKGGAFLQLSDVLGVDRELGFSLSTRRYPTHVDEHFITADLHQGDHDREIWVGEGGGDVVAIGRDTEVLACADSSVLVSAHPYGAGRGVYLAGLPYSPQNSRLLERAVLWACGREDELTRWHATDPRVEVAAYPDRGVMLVLNNTADAVSTTVFDGQSRAQQVELAPREGRWIEL